MEKRTSEMNDDEDKNESLAQLMLIRIRTHRDKAQPILRDCPFCCIYARISLSFMLDNFLSHSGFLCFLDFRTVCLCRLNGFAIVLCRFH